MMTEAEIMALAEEARKKYKPNQEDEENPHQYDYPEFCERVTYGTANCELVLFFGSKYTAIVDAGMCYPAPKIIENIEAALAKHGRDKIDILLVSHSHYDHVGALPYFLKKWPEMKVYGSEKAKKVFESEGAHKVMKELGENARDSYYDGLWKTTEIITDPLRIDVVVHDGDRVEIGQTPESSISKSSRQRDTPIARWRSDSCRKKSSLAANPQAYTATDSLSIQPT